MGGLCNSHVWILGLGRLCNLLLTCTRPSKTSLRLGLVRTSADAFCSQAAPSRHDDHSQQQQSARSYCECNADADCHLHQQRPRSAVPYHMMSRLQSPVNSQLGVSAQMLHLQSACFGPGQFSLVTDTAAHLLSEWPGLCFSWRHQRLNIEQLAAGFCKCGSVISYHWTCFQDKQCNLTDSQLPRLHVMLLAPCMQG